jgi:ParB family chromosome partitioning protein
MEKQRTTGGVTVLEVPVDRIRPDEGQARKTFDGPELDELIASVRQVGVLEPIELRPDGEEGGRYVIVYGERRWRAAQAAGLATVPALVNGETRQLRRRQLYENVVRVDLNVVELASNVAAVMAEERIDTKRLADQLRWPLRRIQRFVEIHEAPDAVKRAIVKGIDAEGVRRSLTLSHALDVVRAYRHYAREDGSESKGKALVRLDRLIATVLEEDWSARKLQEYVGALGRSPKRDPLDRVAKNAAAKPASANEPESAAPVAAAPAAGRSDGLRSAPKCPTLFEAKTDRFTIFVKRARESQDAAARTALGDALLALVKEFAS